MSTISLNKHIIDLAVQNPGLPPIEATSLIFSTRLNLSIPQIAKKAGVSSQAAYVDIRGGKKCPRFRKQVENDLGFIPWDSQ